VGDAVRTLDCPEEIEDGEASGAGTDGDAQFTVTMAVRLSVEVLQPLMRTQ
jgi:hypothetical protein